MSSKVPVISCKDLAKSYQKYERPFHRFVQALTGRVQDGGEQFFALRDVTFDLLPGESIGIIGANGSGKSTLLQIICGTLQPTSGRVFVTRRIAALLELGAGFNPEFTGRENVYLNGTLLGLTHEQIDARYQDIVDFADIGLHIDMPVKTYSSGMYVRLAFAIAAHVDADALVIDEALSVGDFRFAQKCMRFMRSFREKGTLLFVSHDSGAVINLCERALWLDAGRLRMDGDAKEVVESYLAEQHAKDREEAGAIVKTGLSTPQQEKRKQQARDVRQDLINASSRRSLIQVVELDAPRSGFGAGGASITAVELLDENGEGTGLLMGGEMAGLVIHAQAVVPLQSVIVGFYLKDRLGQRLFGDNTHLSYCDQPIDLEAGDTVSASFIFRMPLLPAGEYSVDVAIATGSQDEHTQQAWIHDAIVLQSGGSNPIYGLVGVPMSEIRLLKNEATYS